MTTRPPTDSSSGGTIARRAARAGGPDGAERADRSRPRDPVRDHDGTGELEARRDFLLRSIEDLDRQHAKGEVSDEDYSVLRDDYTARAAEVIRTLESPNRAVRRSDELRAYGSQPGDRRIGTTVAIAVVVIVVGVAAGVMVARSSGTAPAGSTMSVGADGAGSRVDELMATARSRVAEAQRSLASGDGADAAGAFREALRTYDEVLALEPDNVEAMAYRGWLLHNLAVQTDRVTATELDTEALEWLDRAVATDSGYPDARVFRAVVLDSLGRPAEALDDLDAVDTSSVPPALAQMIGSRRASIEAEMDESGPDQPDSVEGGT